MKVLFASANYGGRVVGGAQLSIRSVAQYLVAKGHEVGVVLVDPVGQPREVDEDGVKLFRVPSGNIYWHLSPRQNALKRLLWHANDRFGGSLSQSFGKVLDEFKPDILHTNVLSGLTVSIWPEAHKRRIPIVHTVHDYYLLCANSGMRSAKGNCERPCGVCGFFSIPSHRAAKLVSSVIYVSEHMKKTHEREGVFAGDAHVTEIIGSFERQSPVPVREARSGPLRIGFLGRIAPDKGLDRLIEELRQVAPDRYVLKIGGAGSGEYENKLKGKAAGMPVEFLGRVQPDSFFDSIDVLIVPSLWNEPAGRVVFEAGLSRVPVIVSNRGGLPQLAGYGKLGWIYEPDSQGDLARTVEGILNDREGVTAKVAAWSEIEHMYAPDSVARQTLDAYEQAARVCRERAA